jgi:hypothetical protein
MGLYLYLSSHNNSFTNITLVGNTLDSIYMVSSQNNTFNYMYAENDITLVTSTLNRFNNFTLYNTLYGIYLSTSSNYNSFRDFNNNGAAVNNLWIHTASINNSFMRGIFNNTQSLIADISGSSNTYFEDVQIINETAVNGAFKVYATSPNTMLINTTMSGVTEDVPLSSNSQIIRKWYLDVYVNDSDSNNVDGANVSIWNSSGMLINYSLTNTTGWIVRLNVTQYFNDSGATSNYNPYTLYANISSGIYYNDSLTPTIVSSLINKNVHLTLFFGINITSNYTNTPYYTTSIKLNISSGIMTFNYSSQTVTWLNATPENQTATQGIYNITNQNLTTRIRVYLDSAPPGCMYVYMSNASQTSNIINLTDSSVSNPKTLYNIFSTGTSVYPFWWISMINCTVPLSYSANTVFLGG